MSQCIFDFNILNKDINFIKCIYNDNTFKDLDSIDLDAIDEITINIDFLFKTDETDEDEIYKQVNANYLNYNLYQHIYSVYSSITNKYYLKEIPCVINVKVRHVNSKGEDIWTMEVLNDISEHMYRLKVFNIYECIVPIYDSNIIRINFDCECLPIFINNTSDYVRHQRSSNLNMIYKLKDCTALVGVSPMQILPTDIKGHIAKYDNYTKGYLDYDDFVGLSVNYMYPINVMIETENSTVNLHRYDKVLTCNNFNGVFDLTKRNQLDVVGFYTKLKDEINFSIKDSVDPNSKESYLKVEFTADKDLTFHVDFSDKKVKDIFKEFIWVVDSLTGMSHNVRAFQGFCVWKCDFLNGLYYFNQINPENPYALPSDVSIPQTNIAYLKSGDILRRLLLAQISTLIHRKDIRGILKDNTRHLLNHPTEIYSNLISIDDEYEFYEYKSRRLFKTDGDFVDFGAIHCYNGMKPADCYEALRALHKMYKTDTLNKTYIIFDNCKLNDENVVKCIFKTELPSHGIYLRNNTHILTEVSKHSVEYVTLTQQDMDTLSEVENTLFKPHLLKRVYCDVSSSISILDFSRKYNFHLSDTEEFRGGFYIGSQDNETDEDYIIYDTDKRGFLHWLPIEHDIFKLVEAVSDTLNDSLTNDSFIVKPFNQVNK